MKRYIVLFLMIIMACSCFAQSPEELLSKYVTNVSVPDKNIETFHFQLTINVDGDIYPVQVWYKNEGHFGFNLFDKDKTPILIIRNDNVLFYNVIEKQVMYFPKNITIVKAVYENEQLVANVNYHQPNEEEKENTVQVGFLDLANNARKDMTAAEKDGLLEIIGHTDQGSVETTLVDPKASFPLKTLKIDTGDSIILFDDVSVNAPMTGNEEFFTFPAEALKKSGVKVIEVDSDSFLSAMQMMQVLMQGCMVRTAIYNESFRADLEKGMNTKFDWAGLKASDMLNSAKLRQIFKVE